MLDQIKQSLERRTLLEERPVLTGTRAGARHLQIRRFVAAAAMIALLGGLGAVVYQIVAPVAPTSVSGPVARIEPVEPGFSGRLELRTAAFAQADSFVKRAIENNGLLGRSQAETRNGARIYRVESSPEELNRLVANLGTIWQEFDSAALTVSSGQFADAVVVEPVTLEQATRIIDQDSLRSSVAVAQDIAVLNDMTRAIPGADLPLMADNTLPPPIIPGPVLTSDDPETKPLATAPEGDVKASLTIVLLNTQ
jgi:hypothetical protein